MYRKELPEIGRISDWMDDELSALVTRRLSSAFYAVWPRNIGPVLELLGPGQDRSITLCQ